MGDLIQLETRLRRDLKSLFELEIDVTLRRVDLIALRVEFSRGENNYLILDSYSYSYLVNNYKEVRREIADRILDKVF